MHALNNRALVFLKLGRNDDAVNDCDRVVELIGQVRLAYIYSLHTKCFRMQDVKISTPLLRL